MSAISAGPGRGFLISKTISTIVDGVQIEGTVIGSSFDITITITKPFKNLSQGFYIMYAIRGVHSFDGEYGDWRAQDTLLHLYELGQYCQKNWGRLRENLEQVQQAISKLLPDDSDTAQDQISVLKERYFEENFTDTESLSIQESLWEILVGNNHLT